MIFPSERNAPHHRSSPSAQRWRRRLTAAGLFALGFLFASNDRACVYALRRYVLLGLRERAALRTIHHAPGVTATLRSNGGGRQFYWSACVEGDMGVKSLRRAEVLQAIETLHCKKLVFRNCAVGHHSMALPKMDCMSLAFVDCHIGSHLHHALRVMRQLSHLYLRDCRLETRDLLDTIGQHPTVQYLSLEGTRVTADEAAKVLRAPRLRYVDLRATGIGPETAESLASAATDVYVRSK